MGKIRVAVIGSGNIGADLCEKILLDGRFELFAIVGRNAESSGLKRFEGRARHVISDGYFDLFKMADEFDGIFDATSAFSHSEHWDACIKTQKWAIDLTPSKIGKPLVPALIGFRDEINLGSEEVSNYSMVTCGGQSSAPMINAFADHCESILSVEVSSSIASLSAGPATRLNIDQYIDTTENLAKLITKCDNSKAILVLNPAEPPVMMRTTVTVQADNIDLRLIKDSLHNIEKKVQKYVPGYQVVVEPYLLNSNVVSATAKVTGAGHFLPPYAGNLDIINSAAIETAKLHFDKFNTAYLVGSE
jgi:acetaldehyde dehydrogenase (acetylating)